MRLLLDVVAPARCVACGEVGDELCPRCAARVEVLAGPGCDRCGAPTRQPVPDCGQCRDLRCFGRARSLVAFAEPARALTLALKRRGQRRIVRPVGGLMAELARAEGISSGVVAYVPAGRRARAAGFDHVELVAKAVARALGSRIEPLLYRAKEGPRQADVRFVDRRGNVEGRFAARPVSGRILLVDDVFTTGSTAEACSLALRAAGAESVEVITWARTLRRFRRD